MITPAIRGFRQKIASRVVVGPFSKTSDPASVEVMGHSRFDFVVLDLEHGPSSVQSRQNLFRAAPLSGALPMVRVKEKALSLVGEVIDVEAGGAGSRVGEAVIVIRLEGVEALDNIDEILSVEGIDAVFVGPYDSGDVGLFTDKCCEVVAGVA